jgi:osmotically inducible lipoprotein OsmB
MDCILLFNFRETAMKSYKIVAASILLVFLSACGHDPGERALSGAGIGAGAGAIGGALLGNPLAGAAVGGAVGAAAGGLTSDKQINMGKPAWK